jgi:hypothetical protein
MKEKTKPTALLKEHEGNDNQALLPGYPIYPASQDIYSHARKENDLDPEDVSKLKGTDESDKAGPANEKDFYDDVSGGDLDVPGSELDDQQEEVGSEDEENNYYSLGGDGHNDLDETNTD